MYHLRDADDLALLQKLITDENEFVLAAFDVFESDRDQENLLDTLLRIVEKYKKMGLSKNSVIASSFYITPPPGPTPTDSTGDKRKQVKINEVSNISVIPNYFSSGEEEQPHPNAQRVIH